MRPKVLVAGIGNIFLADDAFGVEVVRRLAAGTLPEGVSVQDFGIRGFDLAYAMMEPWDLVILVDAAQRGGAPGTLYVIEREEDLEPTKQAALEPHGMDPVRALDLVRALGGTPPRVRVVACEPEDLGGAEGRMGLSAAVAAAISPAVQLVFESIEWAAEGSRLQTEGAGR